MIPDNVKSLLLKCEKVETEAILLKCAIDYAEQGVNVWFISPQRFKQLPENISTPEKEILKLITFLYLKDQKDLITHLSGIHLWHRFPQVLILNQLDNYCSTEEYEPINAAFTIASLLDATAACAHKHVTKHAYLLVLVDIDCVKKIKHLNVFSDLYFSSTLTYNKNDSVDIIHKIKNCFNG